MQKSRVIIDLKKTKGQNKYKSSYHDPYKKCLWLLSGLWIIFQFSYIGFRVPLLRLVGGPIGWSDPFSKNIETWLATYLKGAIVETTIDVGNVLISCGEVASCCKHLQEWDLKPKKIGIRFLNENLLIKWLILWTNAQAC